jgi:hypothetical protein
MVDFTSLGLACAGHSVRALVRMEPSHALSVESIEGLTGRRLVHL